MNNEIKTFIMPLAFYGVNHGEANGYVGVPKDHPYWGKDYNSIEGVSVHGGLTYGADHLPMNEPDGYWWFGFDTAHSGDCVELWPAFAVMKETKLLAEQLAKCSNIREYE